MAQKLDAKAAGYSVAIIFAGIMLLFGILGRLNLYMDAIELMQKWHVFFNLTITGIIAGIIEGAVAGFVVAYIFVYLYNKFV